MSELIGATPLWFAQSVNGFVDLIGGEEVGLTCEKIEPNVVVRLDLDKKVKLGWFDDGEKFIPYPSYQTLLDSKIASLNESCRLAIESGFTWNGKVFKSAVDPDQNNIALAALQFITTSESIIQWETKDNEVVTLTYADFQSFSQAFGLHKMSNLAKVKTLKTQVLALDVNSSTFVDDLNSINW